MFIHEQHLARLQSEVARETGLRGSSSLAHFTLSAGVRSLSVRKFVTKTTKFRHLLISLPNRKIFWQIAMYNLPEFPFAVISSWASIIIGDNTA